MSSWLDRERAAYEREVATDPAYNIPGVNGPDEFMRFQSACTQSLVEGGATSFGEMLASGLQRFLGTTAAGSEGGHSSSSSETEHSSEEEEEDPAAEQRPDDPWFDLPWERKRLSAISSELRDAAAQSAEMTRILGREHGSWAQWRDMHCRPDMTAEVFQRLGDAVLAAREEQGAGGPPPSTQQQQHQQYEDEDDYDEDDYDGPEPTEWLESLAGQWMTLEGLVNQPQLNGKKVRIQRYDANKRRFVVRTTTRRNKRKDRGRLQLSVKFENLVPCDQQAIADSLYPLWRRARIAGRV